MSLRPTNSMLGLLMPARKTRRPMRPKPLIATLRAMTTKLLRAWFGWWTRARCAAIALPRSRGPEAGSSRGMIGATRGVSSNGRDSAGSIHRRPHRLLLADRVACPLNRQHALQRHRCPFAGVRVDLDLVHHPAVDQDTRKWATV